MYSYNVMSMNCLTKSNIANQIIKAFHMSNCMASSKSYNRCSKQNPNEDEDSLSSHQT